MPYVRVEMTREGATPRQKADVIKGITDVMQNILGKDPRLTFVVIDEIALEDWGVGGLPVDAYRATITK